MKRAAILLSVLLYFSASAQDADTSQKAKFRDRLFYGGDIQLNFSNVGFVVGASPILGYRVTDRLSAGVGVSFVYYSIDYGLTRFNSTVYGGNVFARYQFTDFLFGTSEFHVVNSDVPSYDPATQELSIVRQNIPIWYVGGGYIGRISQNSFVTFAILYDLIDSPYSPYRNPMFRGGVAIGF